METIGPFRPPFGPALGWPAQEGPPCAGTNRAEMGAAPRKEAGLRQMREREGRHTRCGIPPVDDHASAQIRSLSGDGFLCRRPVIPVAIRNRAIRRPARAPCRSPGPLCILSQCSRLVRSRPTPQGAGRFRPSSIRAAALPCRIPQAYSPPPGTNSRFSPIGTGLAGSLKKQRGILRGSPFAKERTYRAPGGCYCRRAPGQLPLSLARCFF